MFYLYADETKICFKYYLGSNQDLVATSPSVKVIKPSSPKVCLFSFLAHLSWKYKVSFSGRLSIVILSVHLSVNKASLDEGDLSLFKWRATPKGRW